MTTSPRACPSESPSPPRPPQPTAVPSGRPWRSTAVAAAVLTAAGLVVSTRVSGVWGDALGDALYAALVLVLVRLLAPHLSPLTLGTVALGICAVVELAQITGIPAAVVRVLPPARYLLGTTFAATDLLAYAAGCASAALVVLASARTSRPYLADHAVRTPPPPPVPRGS